MRRAFTLIELLVVIAMIAIIAGALSTGVAKAQRRSKISRAQTEAREITNAILAYANYAEDGTLSELEGLNEDEATENNLKYILGKTTSRNSQVPVLYNAALKGGKILDPWGNPYRITVKKGQKINPPSVNGVKIRMFYPNWHRIGGNGL